GRRKHRGQRGFHPLGRNRVEPGGLRGRESLHAPVENVPPRGGPTDGPPQYRPDHDQYQSLYSLRGWPVTGRECVPLLPECNRCTAPRCRAGAMHTSHAPSRRDAEWQERYPWDTLRDAVPSRVREYQNATPHWLHILPTDAGTTAQACEPCR